MSLFWRKIEDGKVQCGLCPHRCLIAEGKTGLCKIRRVERGGLVADGYGRVSSAHVDPIEKKPLYHFFPGSPIFSLGGWGCNFGCKFCQNWSISQGFNGGGRIHGPEEIVAEAGADDSIGIAYTYNEPLINMEFVHDCAALAAERKLVNVLVTNGFVEPGPADYILPVVDALNIDIKSMDDDFYRSQCGGSLEPVLSFAKQAVAAGCHVEITNLVIPGVNDEEDQLGRLSSWISENLGRSTPLHLGAYRPEFKMSVPATPLNTMERARARCSRDLDYVYIGNVISGSGIDTLCPGCGACLVSRRGYSTEIKEIKNGNCAKCGRRADIVLKRKDRA